MNTAEAKADAAGAGGTPAVPTVVEATAPAAECPFTKAPCLKRCDPAIGPRNTHCTLWVEFQQQMGMKDKT